MEVDEVSREDKAIELYEKGAAKEAIGLMSDAIIYYSSALRTHHDVEKLYRIRLQNEYQKQLSERQSRINTVSKGLKSLNLNTISNTDTDDDNLDDVIDMEPCWIFDILTDDILLEIISVLIYTDQHAHVNLSSTCQRFSKLAFDSLTFKHISKIVYPKQVYSSSSLQLNNIQTNQELMVKNWDYDWKSMLNDRPFLKYQGCYISKVSYVSDGARSSSFYAPVKLVTYFRYLRFYPDGTVLKLTTTDEPSLIVPFFDKEIVPNWKNASIARFTMELDGQVTLQRETEDYQFIEELQIVNLGYRKFHRLNWISSSTINKEGERGYFSLKKEKPFNFSGVLSYKVDI